MLRRNLKRESEFAGPLEVSATWVHVGMNLGRFLFPHSRFCTLALTHSLTHEERAGAGSVIQMLVSCPGHAAAGKLRLFWNETTRASPPRLSQAPAGEFTRACTILPIVYRVQFLFALYLLQRYILYCSGAHGSEPSSSKHEFRPTQEIRHVHPQDQGLLRPVE